MKFTLLDFFITIVVLALISVSAFFMVTILACVVNHLPIEYQGLSNIAIFCAVFLIFLGGVYSKILRFISPPADAVFSSDDNSIQCIIWKQTVFAYEWTASILTYITPVILRPTLFQLLGAKFGKGVLIAGKIVEPQMVEIGDYSFTGEMSLLMAHALMKETVVLKRIIIGNYVSVGAHAVIMPGVRIGDESIVAAGALVSMGTVIPPGEVWGGIPARKIGDIDQSHVIPEGAASA